MPNLSTLTPEALHALVAKSLEGVTAGPWPSELNHPPYKVVWIDKKEQYCTLELKPEDAAFIAQSRDLVPELDRRLSDEESRRKLAEARLRIATETLRAVRSGLCYPDEYHDVPDAALTRIANLTQP